jgi:hypothetical protein
VNGQLAVHMCGVVVMNEFPGVLCLFHYNQVNLVTSHQAMLRQLHVSATVHTLGCV